MFFRGSSVCSISKLLLFNHCVHLNKNFSSATVRKDIADLILSNYRFSSITTVSPRNNLFASLLQICRQQKNTEQAPDHIDFSSALILPNIANWPLIDGEQDS